MRICTDALVDRTTAQTHRYERYRESRTIYASSGRMVRGRIHRRRVCQRVPQPFPHSDRVGQTVEQRKTALQDVLLARELSGGRPGQGVHTPDGGEGRAFSSWLAPSSTNPLGCCSSTQSLGSGCGFISVSSSRPEATTSRVGSPLMRNQLLVRRFIRASMDILSDMPEPGGTLPSEIFQRRR